MLDDQVLSTMGTRSKHPPYGLFGGWPGATNAFISTRDGESRRLGSKTVNRNLTSGERLTINTGGGGGYGRPWCRDSTKVARDVENELCDVTDAAAIYGVALNKDGGVDEEETRRLRASSEWPDPPGDGGTRAASWCAALGARRTLGPAAIEQARRAWTEGRLSDAGA
jgi:N-methylhydantoinase B